MLAHDGHELVGVVQADLVQPLAADRDRVMMQAHQHVMIAMGAQHLAQIVQLLGADASAGVVGDPGIQHDHQPAAELGVPADS